MLRCVRLAMCSDPSYVEKATATVNSRDYAHIKLLFHYESMVEHKVWIKQLSQIIRVRAIKEFRNV